MSGSLTVKMYEALCRLGGTLKHAVVPSRKWQGGLLEEGWVIANHKLVSFHAAFLSSLFMLVGAGWSTGRVLQFMFSPVWVNMHGEGISLGYEVMLSCLIWYLSWHINIAIHEMGHYVAAVKTSNLRPELMAEGEKNLNFGGYLKMLVRIPWGKFRGVKKESGSYFPDIKAHNVAVSAAGPLTSGKLAMFTLVPGIVLVAVGFGLLHNAAVIWVGRLLFTVGVVALLDRLLADSGKVATYRARLSGAAQKAAEARRAAGGGKWDPLPVKKMMIAKRLQEVALAGGAKVRAPWQYRNCLMGGRHTEEQGGNLSFQEFMFLPLSATDYVEAQRMTNALQSRVIQIVQDSEGMNFVGIGLEGGMVGGYSRRAEDACPEERAVKVAVQAIEECGFVPGKDVALALDPACSELSIAYREHTQKSDAIGQYFFWRAEEPRVMNSEELVEMYKDWVAKYPIVSIEDGFAEDDPEGWKMLMKEMGDKIFVIGDDLVVTKDTTIARCIEQGLMNTALIKANQIGCLCETLLATHAAKSRGAELVISHRSKSPNDTMEADIAFAVDAMGMKCGGGANTERLVKYARIVELMRMAQKGFKITKPMPGDMKIADMTATEVATNAGIPTVGVTVRLENGVTFQGATPLGTSAGTDEAIHLVDSIIEKCPATDKFADLLDTKDGGKTFKFKKGLTTEQISAKHDAELSELWRRSQRYAGKGCLNAAENVEKYIAPLFVGKTLAEVGSLVDVDRKMLALELDLAAQRGKIATSAGVDERIHTMQRKANLGMNAILSVSLALGRLTAARDGVELSDILRAMEGKIDRDLLYGTKGK
jgi:phosphopyruvate hydratase